MAEPGTNKESRYYALLFPVILPQAPVLIAVDTAVRLVTAACCREIPVTDPLLRGIMNKCIELVQEAKLPVSGYAMPDARRGNRWALSINNCMPKLRPVGSSQDSFCTLLALLYDVVAGKRGILSLRNYRDAEEWTFGEVAKRTKMLAALIAA